MTTVCDLGASEIARDVHSGTFTASAVSQAFLERTGHYDDRIRAFATLDPEMVSSEAARVDDLHRRGARLPLHGVPVGVKDIIDVAGMPTMAGFEPYRNRIAHQDAAIVARLRALGAVMLGKTHTTQFAVGDPAPTCNPWNLEKSPAGSSAGSGAAIAAKMAPITLGSQTAGSVLRPAAFNGVVGFKPSIGWFPLDGVIPLCWSLDHLGLYGVTVDDVALVYRALVDRHVDQQYEAPGRPRIALFSEFLEMSDSEVADHVKQVAETLKSAGTEVIETSMPEPFEFVYAVHQVIFSAEMSAVHSANLRRHTEHYGPRIRTGVEAGSLVPASYLLQAQRHRSDLSAVFDEFLSQFDAAIFPTVSTEACDRAETGDRRFQVPATLLGVPAISLPTGMSSAGLPLGTQLISRRGNDHQLLALSKWVTEAVPLIGRPDLNVTLPARAI